MRRRRGSNAIEFALTVPAFVLGAFGALQLGLFFFAWMMADEGARRACNDAAMLDDGTVDLAQAAETRMTSFYGHGGFTCAQLGCSAQVSGATPSRVVRCTANANLSDMYGLMVLPLDGEHERVLAFQ